MEKLAITLPPAIWKTVPFWWQIFEVLVRFGSIYRFVSIAQKDDTWKDFGLINFLECYGSLAGRDEDN